MAQAFPLQWPEGWPRTPASKRMRSRFKVTPDSATNGLLHSLQLLKADRRSIVISTNIPLRRDGLPYADRKTPEDPGAAVYWVTRSHGERVIACDRWEMVHENIRAMQQAIDGLRAIERAGASQILERAFTAFGALPASPEATQKRPWWEVLGFPEAMIGVLSVPVIEARYRELAAKAHPDRTGNEAALVELNAARAEAKEHFK